jgi:hypothetical protein
MPPHNNQALLTAPLAELVVLLLKQFRRLLQDNGVTLSTQDMDAIAQSSAQHTPTHQHSALVEALIALVDESEQELMTRFNMSFTQALASDMQTIKGWETTAEFLELANHKSNAELRISAASTLLVFLEDRRKVAHLWVVITEDDGLQDVEALLAQRAICHVLRLDPLDTDWQTKARKELDNVD